MSDVRALGGFAAPHVRGLALGAVLMHMFDPEGESDFLRVCRPVFRDRTVILITHRPASLAVADRILRFDGGRLVPGLMRAAAERSILRTRFPRPIATRYSLQGGLQG